MKVIFRFRHFSKSCMCSIVKFPSMLIVLQLLIFRRRMLSLKKKRREKPMFELWFKRAPKFVVCGFVDRMGDVKHYYDWIPWQMHLLGLKGFVLMPLIGGIDYMRD